MFKTRLLSGIVLVIILIATVGTGGGLLFGFLALISLIGLSELYKVVDVQSKVLGLPVIWQPLYITESYIPDRCSM